MYEPHRGRLSLLHLSSWDSSNLPGTRIRALAHRTDAVLPAGILDSLCHHLSSYLPGGSASKISDPGHGGPGADTLLVPLGTSVAKPPRFVSNGLVGGFMSFSRSLTVLGQAAARRRSRRVAVREPGYLEARDAVTPFPDGSATASSCGCPLRSVVARPFSSRRAAVPARGDRVGMLPPESPSTGSPTHLRHFLKAGDGLTCPWMPTAQAAFVQL
jgi:hypothetical protein